MGDIDRVSIVNEAQELVDAFGQRLLALENRGVRRDELAECFRIVHTLKGLAVSVGQLRVAEVAHRVETLLDRANEDLEINPASLDLLYESAETFVRLLSKPESTNSAGAELIDELCARLEAAAVSSPSLVSRKRAALATVDPDVLDVLTRRERRHLQEAMSQGGSIVRVSMAWPDASLRTAIARFKEAIGSVGELIALVPGQQVGRSVRLDAILATEATVATLNSAATAAGARPISIGGIKAESKHADDAVLVRSNSRSVRVDIRKVDGLLGSVGELSLLAASVSAAALALRSAGKTVEADALEADIEALDRRIGEIQRRLLSVRMVSLGPMLARLGRVARRIAQTTNKRVQFKIIGADTEVDKVIVEELAEPLLHLIRNAIDHGIEPTTTRQKLGKIIEGQISISAYQEGGQLIVELRDDGYGIDRERVLEAAVAYGLCTVEAGDAFTDREVLDLLFEPGFSTRESADLVSGRGVGLDAVRACIGRLGGVIGLNSETGEGARFMIRVPITLAMVHAILVRVADRTYAMPVSGVVESASVAPADLSGGAPTERMVLRRQSLAVARVSELLGTSARAKTTSHQTVVVSGVGSSRVGLLVDEILGAQDVVVKPLPRCLAKVRAIAGAVELGGKQTVLVLDVPVLLELARKRQTAAGMPTGDLSSVSSEMATELPPESSGGNGGAHV